MKKSILIQNFHQNISKFSQNFPKICVFRPKAQTSNAFFYKSSVNFSRVWTKNTNCWEIEKILKFFDKYSLEKLNFYLFLEKLLLKIEPSEMTSFFYNKFFNFGGGGNVPCVPPPGGATGFQIFSRNFGLYLIKQKDLLRFAGFLRIFKSGLRFLQIFQLNLSCFSFFDISIENKTLK